jgi:hypothetical protein
LVLLDNASAEFTFIVRFFARATSWESETMRTREGTPIEASDTMSEVGRSRTGFTEITEGTKDAERIWHEVFDPALDSCSSFFTSVINPPPPAVPLLTLIRLNDRVLATANARGAIPLIAYLQGWKLAMWPVYNKEMDAHVQSLKLLADQAEGKGFSGLVKGVKDGAVSQVANRYAALFTCVTALSGEAEEAMIFSRWATSLD